MSKTNDTTTSSLDSKNFTGKDVGFEGLDLVQIAVKIGSSLAIYDIFDKVCF